MHHVGLDSQCLTYLIEAISGGKKPTDSLASQKVALLRCYLYLPDTLWVSPTVVDECARIRNVERAKLHQKFVKVLFGELPVSDSARVSVRTNEFFQFHARRGDCRILAEAEDIGFTALMSFDAKFVGRLARHSPVRLLRPTEFWHSLAVPRDSPPDKLPHHTSQLSRESWWRW